MNKKTKLTKRITSLLSSAAIAVSVTGVLSNAASDEMSITGTVKANGSEAASVAVIVIDKDSSNAVFSGTAENGEINVPKLTEGEYTVIFGKTYYASRAYDVTVGAETVELNAEISRYGDLNSDGEITTADVAIVNAHAKNISVLEDYNFKLGDVNIDGAITTADCGMINSHARGVKDLKVIDPDPIIPTEPTEPSEPSTEPTTEPDTKPKEPQDVGIIKLDSVEINNTSATIDYTQAKNACGARIWAWEAKQNGNDEWQTIGDPVILSNYRGDDTIFELTGLKAGTTYRYRIKAFNFYYPDGTTQTTSWGDEYWNVFTTTGTAVQQPTNPTTAPKAPEYDSVDYSNGTVNVKLKTNGAYGYRLWYADNKSFSGEQKLEDNKTGEFTITGLKKGKVYFLKAYAYNLVNGESKWSDAAITSFNTVDNPVDNMTIGSNPYETGDIGDTGRQWIKDTLTGKTTIEKIELINEKTIELMQQFPQSSIGSYYDLGEDLSFSLAGIYDNPWYYEVHEGLVTKSDRDLIKWIWTYGNNPTWPSTYWDDEPEGGDHNHAYDTVSPDKWVYGGDVWNYGLIFASICKAAGIELYAQQSTTEYPKEASSNAQVFMIIEDGVIYYTCPVLNAYFKLGKYGADSMNTYTNITDPEEMSRQLIKLYEYRKNLFDNSLEKSALSHHLSGNAVNLYPLYYTDPTSQKVMHKNDDITVELVK